jgi:hypothetical protein
MAFKERRERDFTTFIHRGRLVLSINTFIIWNDNKNVVEIVERKLRILGNDSRSEILLCGWL